MAKPRKLNFHEADLTKAKNDFAALGQDGKAYLEAILVSGGFVADSLAMAFNEGRRDLAGELLGYTRPDPTETKTLRNVED